MLLVPFDHHMSIPRVPGCSSSSIKSTNLRGGSLPHPAPAGVAHTPTGPRPPPPPPRSALRAVLLFLAASIPHVATLTALSILAASTFTTPLDAPTAAAVQYVVAAGAIVAVAHAGTRVQDLWWTPRIDLPESAAPAAEQVRALERESARRVVAAAFGIPMQVLVLVVTVRALAAFPSNVVLGAGVFVHAVALGVAVGRALEVPRLEDEIHAARHAASSVPVSQEPSCRSLARHEDWDATESRRSSNASSGSGASRRASAMSFLEKVAAASASDQAAGRESSSLASRWVYGSTAVGTLTAATGADTVDRPTRAAAVLKAIKLADSSGGTSAAKTGAVAKAAASLPRGTTPTAAVPVNTAGPLSPGTARKYVPKRRYSMSSVHAGGVHEGVSAQSLRSQAGVAHASTSSTTSPRRRGSMPSSPRSADPIRVSQSTTSTTSTGRSRRASATDVPTTRRTSSATASSNLHAFMAAHHIVELMSDERLAADAERSTSPPVRAPVRASDATPPPARPRDAMPPPPASNTGNSVETDSLDSLAAPSPTPAPGNPPRNSGDRRRTRSATATAASSTFRPKHVVNSCPTIVVVPPPVPVPGTVGAGHGGEESGERKESAGMLSAELGRMGT
ncbi:hypothetical protein AMAG_07878 [Allomyces macrogynus ATCC 38327]|uniref:Uncharacterized protein n=1 Tax=Allomyces macrogynus (strain ATCC 38327) TaxID=578462 RepID=A0A0L0SJL9_ALLM3|nr:hypothetical protein AMAG_07878 [Allomyces macrogynus ATCC 38327]|eukprot:KNE62686.1 hypothetical protein AMAG_07878 [Allomyces macrogynus ATCC 38327]